MTTPLPDQFFQIPQIEDRRSLRLMSRLIEGQRTMLEAQLEQLRQMQEAVDERIEELGK